MFKAKPAPAAPAPAATPAADADATKEKETIPGNSSIQHLQGIKLTCLISRLNSATDLIKSTFDVKVGILILTLVIFDPNHLSSITIGHTG